MLKRSPKGKSISGNWSRMSRTLHRFPTIFASNFEVRHTCSSLLVCGLRANL